MVSLLNHLSGAPTCRLPVYAVLELLEDGATFDDILRDYYPDITRDDIKASIRAIL